MADETILLKIEVDNDKAQKDIEEQTKLITQLKKANKDLSKEGKKDTEQYAKNQAEIQKLNSSRRQNIKLVSSEKGSLNELRANLAKLTTQRNATNASTKQGAKEFNRLNKEIKKQNESIKGAEQAGGDFRRNVGNYGSALSGVSPTISGVVQGFTAMRTAAMAFIATPIGAVIAAIGVAVGALTQYFRDNEEGQNKLTAITNRLSALWGILTDTVSDLGNAIFDAFSNPQQALESIGDSIKTYLIDQFNLVLDGLGLLGKGISLLFEGEFTKAAETAGKGLKKIFIDTQPIVQVTQVLTEKTKDLNKELEKRISIADTLSNKEKKINKLERENLVDRAKSERDIANLRLKAKKEDQFTAQERISFLEEAKKINDDLFKQEEELAQLKFDSKVAENQLSKTNIEDKKEQFQLEADLIRVQTQRANANRKIETEIQTNIKKRTSENIRLTKETDLAEQTLQDNRIQRAIINAETEKEKESLEIELSRQRTQREYDEELNKQAIKLGFDKETLSLMIENKQLQVASLTEIEEQSQQDIINIQKRYIAEKNKIEDKEVKKEIKRKQTVKDITINLASNVFRAVGSFLKQGSAEQKAFAIADATINTYAGVTKALKETTDFTPTQSLRFANAAAVGITGFAQVAKIASTSPSGGGGTGGASITPPSSGAGAATPQISTNAIDQQLQQQEALIAATNNIGMSISVTEINDVQQSVNISEQTATI